MSGRRSVSISEAASERLDDLVDELVNDYSEGGNLSRAEVVSALIFAAPVEAASLSRLIRFGRLMRITDEGHVPDRIALAQCERSAQMLGWREIE